MNMKHELGEMGESIADDKQLGMQGWFWFTGFRVYGFRVWSSWFRV